MTSNNSSDDRHQSSVRSWIIVVGVALSFFLWGLFLFFTVGDKEPPAWDFGTVQDIPGQSPYSTESGKQFPALVSPPGEGGAKVRRQHVMGRDEEPESTRKKGEP